MNPKTLMILVAAAGATAAGTALVIRRGETAVQSASAELLLPDLSKRVNDVAEVRVQRQSASYTLRRAGDTWGVVEQGGYPIEMESLRKAINGLAEMKIVERKTADPARHEKLGVQDFDAPGSTSALVTLLDASGTELAKLVVGKEADAKGAIVSNQTYVRRAGEAQSWLVAGRVELRPEGKEWLQKEILKVGQDRVRAIEVRQPDGETMLVDRASKDQKDYTLHDLPEGKELTYPTAANSLAGILEWVSLEDVKPAADVDFSAGAGPIARIETFDGLVVTVTTKDQDGKSWASFVASYEPPAEALPGPPLAEGEATANATKSAEDVQREVAELNERLSRWAFAISTYSRTMFGKKKAEMIKDKVAPAPAGGATAPGEHDDHDDHGEHADQPVVIPGHLPPEIQEQIRKHQESLGNEVIVAPPADKPDDAPPPEDEPKR